MQVSKINEVVSPSARKIQSKMTEVIEHFKTKGYISSSPKFERTPDADCFKAVEKTASNPEGPYEVTKFRAKDSSNQELSAFKQHEADETFTMTRDDFNNEGQRIRHIYDLGSEYGEKGITEYEYDGKNLVNETEISSFGSFTSKTIKRIDPQTGNYTVENIYPEINSDLIGREYQQFNSKHQKIMEVRVFNNSSGITNMKTKFDPETSKPIAIIDEYASGSGIAQCEIDNAGNLTKYENTFDDKIMEMFERNKHGEITHYIDNYGNEYKYDSVTGKSTFTYKNGTTTECCSQSLAKDFVENLKFSMPLNIREFL